MTSVVEAIQQLDVEVELMSSGYTSLFQLVNIRINKALKSLVCKDWDDWMLDSGTSVFVVKPLHNS